MAKLTQKDTRSNWRGQQQTSDRKSKGIDIAGNNVSENLIILQAVFYEYSIRVPAETLVFDSRSSLLDSGFSGLSFSWDEYNGYASRGLRLYSERPGRKFQRLNVVGALKNNKIIASAVYTENTNTCFFNNWVENSLCNVLVPGDVVVMDNASFHKSKKTIELIGSSGCEVLFLPPYSPDFNPIENVGEH